MLKTAKDITGERFGRWTVVRREGTNISPSGSHRSTWLCRCDCGVTKILTVKALRSGDTQSCGCLQKERASSANTKHGDSRTSLYRVWSAIKARCHNPNDKAYKYYGARGIYMCYEWRNSFEVFRSDVGDPPFVGAEIDRIDNNGPYSKDNVRWVGREQQMRNMRRNHFLEYNGERKTITEWALAMNVSPNRIHWRLQQGYPIDVVLQDGKLSRQSKRAAMSDMFGL